jgi:hypothetical protein
VKIPVAGRGGGRGKEGQHIKTRQDNTKRQQRAQQDQGDSENLRCLAGRECVHDL